jgi:hypothetical protein
MKLLLPTYIVHEISSARFFKIVVETFFFLELLDPFLRWGLSDGRR